MPIKSDATIEITTFDWVPDFARGWVRDLRPRWACEELGLAYRMRGVGTRERPDWYYAEQPWGQVPVLKDGDIALFESGAILLHLGEKDARLLPAGGQQRASVLSWTLAAFNSVEPSFFELTRVTNSSAAQEWAKLRKPSLMHAMGGMLDRLAAALGPREWLAGSFSIADIAMATVLREAGNTPLLAERPLLAAYLARALARPAFQRALADQLAWFEDGQPKGAAA